MIANNTGEKVMSVSTWMFCLAYLFDMCDIWEGLVELKKRMSSRKQVRVTKPPYTQLLYSKNGVYRGIIFSYFCSKTLIMGTR